MDVSVIIPTYKPGDYVFTCLDSVLLQELPASHYEVIVVLNGPRDPYYDQLQRYADKYAGKAAPVRLLYAERGSVSNARNVGLEAAQGQYIAFVDDDDMMTPTYLSGMLRLAAPDTIVLSNVMALDDSTGLFVPYFITDSYNRNKTAVAPRLFDVRSFFSVVWCKLIPKAMIGQHRFDLDFKLGEDALFMFEISYAAKVFRLASSKCVYYVRMRENSTMHTHYSYAYRLKLAFTTVVRYTAIYLHRPLQYNFPFFLSRIVATVRKLFYRTFR